MWYRMRMERLPWMRKAYMHNCPLFLEHDPSECGEVRSSDKAASWSDSLDVVGNIVLGYVRTLCTSYSSCISQQPIPRNHAGFRGIFVYDQLNSY